MSPLRRAIVRSVVVAALALTFAGETSAQESPDPSADASSCDVLQVFPCSCLIPCVVLGTVCGGLGYVGFLCLFDRDGWFGWVCCGLVDGGPTGGRAVPTSQQASASARPEEDALPWRPRAALPY